MVENAPNTRADGKGDAAVLWIIPERFQYLWLCRLAIFEHLVVSDTAACAQ